MNKSQEIEILRLKKVEEAHNEQKASSLLEMLQQTPRGPAIGQNSQEENFAEIELVGELKMKVSKQTDQILKL